MNHRKFPEPHVSLLLLLFFFVMFFDVTPGKAEEPDSNETVFYQRAGFTMIRKQVQGELQTKPYIITDTIEIVKGTSLSIDPGTLLYLKPGAVILVKGTLVCRGTSHASISFTKVTENGFLREPPDSADCYWSGIILEDSAKLDFRYTIINGSTNGIRVQGKSSSVICENVLMRDNGNGAFVYAGDTIPITEGEFFSLTLPGDGTLNSAPVYNDVQRCPALDNNQVIKTTPHKKLRIAFAISAGTGAAAAISGWIINAVYYDKYSNATDWNKYSVKTVTRWESYTKAGRITGIAGIGLATAALCGFGMTFFF